MTWKDRKQHRKLIWIEEGIASKNIGSNDSSIDGSSLRVKAERNFSIESYEAPSTFLSLVSHNF